MSVSVKQVEDLIKTAIKRFSKELKCEESGIGLLISAEDETGTPSLTLMAGGKAIRELQWDELCSFIQRNTFKTFGFDLNEIMPIWIKKFLLKAQRDCGFKDIREACYIIVMRNEELRPMMIFRSDYIKKLPKVMVDKYENVISIDYILTTKDE